VVSRNTKNVGMRQILVAATGFAIIIVAAILLTEGLFSIVSWQKFDQSLIFRLYRMAVPARHVSESALPIATRSEIEALIPEMLDAGVGMGNVPFKSELVYDAVAINTRDGDECLEQKPGLAKYTTYVRTGDYDRFDPPSVFYDRNAELPPSIQDFIYTYGVNVSEFTTNANGERITLPAVTAERKILIAGDSVAVGSMIDDAETIASQLQRRNAAVQYVNLGMNGATGADAICNLQKAAERYRGQIVRVIYVYCENDFEPADTFSTPEEVVAWLKEFSADNGGVEITIVFAPYIYNIIPQLTRFEGTRGAGRELFLDETRRLARLAQEAGFDYVSIGDVAMQESQQRGTDFAVFALFVDHAHLSAYGVSRLIERLPVN